MITANITGDKMNIAAPFNPDFIAGMKRLGAKWDSTGKAWTLPITRQSEATALCQDIFGTAPDLPGQKSQTVTVRLTATRTITVEQDAARFAGRAVVRAYDRDSGAKPADGCAIISGTVKSGGSKRYWQTIVSEGAVIEVAEVPEAVAVDTDDWAVTIVASETPSREELEAERAALVSRLAEIDRLLEKSPGE